ncbi:MAG: ATP synthase F0 subunit B [Candidatus Eremiobacteraeota bacterium]|nr:ATP synthase F0 subunit B [Candidatus Eremiobacteraeota bacterium]MBV9277874.1 ATP synthase F0 subunit B [Candidatus Eremiobacteraeota bacterium]
MFLKLDGTFIVQLINFAIFFALLNVVFLKPVGNAIRKRREYINSLVAHYDMYREQAADLEAQAEATRSAARREAEAVLAKTRAEASNESAAISEEYSRRANDLIDEAHAAADAELAAARERSRSSVRELAEMMVERTLSEAAS